MLWPTGQCVCVCVWVGGCIGRQALQEFLPFLFNLFFHVYVIYVKSRFIESPGH